MAVVTDEETLQKMNKAFKLVGKESCGNEFYSGHTNTDRSIEH